MGPPSASRLQRRGRRFWFRCRVPVALVPTLGRREILLGLKTDDAALASALAFTLAHRLRALWRAATEASGMVNREKMNEAVKTWLAAELDRLWRLFQDGSFAVALVPDARGEGRAEARRVFGMEASARLDRLQDDYRAGDFRAAAPIAQELVEKHQLGIAKGSQPFGVLCKRVMEAMGEADEARFRWAQGEIEYRPAMLAEASPAPSPALAEDAPANADPGEEPRLLLDAIETFLELVRRERNPTTKELEHLRGELMVLVDAFGPDRDLRRIQPGDAGIVFEALRFLPPRFKGDRRLEGLDLLAKARRARELNGL